MSDQLRHILVRNTTPSVVLVALYIAGGVMIAGGAWFGLRVWSVDVSVVAALPVIFFLTGFGFVGDANRRLSINRVLEEVRAALPKA